jgi:hypothetical protein
MTKLPNPFISADLSADEAAASLHFGRPDDGDAAADRNIDDLIDWDALFDATLPPEPPLFLRNAPPLKAYDLVSMLGVLAGH